MISFEGQLVVGYDGAEESQAAVRWAARLAAERERRVTVLYSWVWPMLTKHLGPVEGIEGSGHRNEARRILQEGVDIAQEAAPEAAVTGQILTGHTRAVLSYATRTADALVVGSRGLGGFLGMLLGSVSLHLVTHSGCPVVVVRHTGPDVAQGPVVVGVDGSDDSLHALSDAVFLAEGWGADVEIVHVRRVVAGMAREDRETAERILDGALNHARTLQASVAVSGRVIESRSAPRGLLEAAGSARLLAVAAAGAGDRSFGSTAHAVIHHSQVDVLMSRRNFVPFAGSDAGAAGGEEGAAEEQISDPGIEI